MDIRTITPEEALFAIYRSNTENGGSTVYNLPKVMTAHQVTATTTSYLITSNDRRVPEERVIFGIDAEGLPYIVDVELD